ncbi:MAG: Spy/CpxP family protein refolding chaperone [Gemmatimonadales bacterium]|nr:Spy/CpxP family protein refolding chaperone [Gemmatimonadales bacterium]
MTTRRNRFLSLLGLGLLLVAPPVVNAQVGGGGRPNAERLRQMVEERFAAQLQAELALSDEQAVRMRRILEASAERRRGMEREERAAQQALRDQLRPGVAAQVDSLSRLLDRLTTLRVAFAQAAKDEIRELGTVLTPVQQAQFLLIRDRMMTRAQDVRMQRPPDTVRP